MLDLWFGFILPGLALVLLGFVALGSRAVAFTQFALVSAVTVWAGAAVCAFWVEFLRADPGSAVSALPSFWWIALPPIAGAVLEFLLLLVGPFRPGFQNVIVLNSSLAAARGAVEDALARRNIAFEAAADGLELPGRGRIGWFFRVDYFGTVLLETLPDRSLRVSLKDEVLQEFRRTAAKGRRASLVGFLPGGLALALGLTLAVL